MCIKENKIITCTYVELDSTRGVHKSVRIGILTGPDRRFRSPVRRASGLRSTSPERLDRNLYNFSKKKVSMLKKGKKLEI